MGARPPEPERFDAVVIGTGQAGKPLARELGEAGRRTAVIERGRVGGTCVLTGCTPTKTMVASARVAWLARRAEGYGVRTGTVEVDLAAVVRRKDGVVDGFSDGSRRRLEETENLELIHGQAAFTAPGTIQVTGRDGARRRLTAPWIFVNAGSRSAVPRVDGMEEVPFLDHASILELRELPRHLLIIGGGYIGLEFGQLFRRFGSAVTIVHRGTQLLSREDADVAAAVEEVLLEDGIEILLETTPVRAASLEDGGVELTVRSRDDEQVLDGSHLLVAAGRVPNSDTLAPEAAGLSLDPGGYIRTNERLETGVDGIWALGDIKGGPAFTHISYDDYRVIRRNLLGEGGASTSGRMLPYTVFIDPQLGRVGLSEAQAAREGLSFRVARLPMEHVARAVEMGETRGFMKVLVEEGTGRLLGAAVLGVEGGEIMGLLQVAMMGGLTSTALQEGIFAHPTLAESLNNLFAALDG